MKEKKEQQDKNDNKKEKEKEENFGGSEEKTSRYVRRRVRSGWRTKLSKCTGMKKSKTEEEAVKVTVTYGK